MGRTEGLRTLADCASTEPGDRSQTIELGPTCYTGAVRGLISVGKGERNTDFFSEEMAGTMSPFKCKSWGTILEDLFPHCKLEAGRFGPTEGEGCWWKPIYFL
jgi:hypothetical protein